MNELIFLALGLGSVWSIGVVASAVRFIRNDWHQATKTGQ